MMKNFMRISLTLVLLFASTESIGAQVRFDVPERVPDYKSYTYLEDCLAAVGRISYIQKNSVKVVDTFSSQRKKKYHNPIPQAVKDTGRICSDRWTLDSVETKFITHWTEDLMALGRTADVKDVYKRYIDSIPAEERLKARGHVRDLYSRYLDDELLSDYLVYWLEYHNEIPADSIPWKFTSLLSKIITWVQLWEPGRADSALNEYISYVNSIPVEKRTSPFISYMAERFFPTAIVVKEPEILQKLTESTTGYSEYLKDLWKKIGHGEELILPIDSAAPTLLGNWMFAPKVEGDGKLTAQKLSDNSLVRPAKGKVNLITFIEGGCHNSSPRATGPGALERQNAQIEGQFDPGNICARTVAAINRIKHTHPDLEVTVVTKTFGSFGNVLSTSPEDEAEVLAKYYIENYGMNAHVVVAETEHFRLPGLDQRRIDIATENEDNYHIAGRRNAGHVNVVLVDQDGKIFYSGIIVLGDEENVARNLVGAALRRSQTKAAQQ